MKQLRLLVLGVGDAFSARYYSSALALEYDQRWLLIDCPHPIRKILREASTPHGFNLDLDRIDGLVLTHLHADHASGLEGIGFYNRFILGRSIPLITHPLVAAEAWPRHLAASMEWTVQEAGASPIQREMSEFYDIRLVDEAAPITFGPFKIYVRQTIHNIPTFALRIEAGPHTLGYSADTKFDPTLIDWLSGADLIVHEASGEFMHTPYRCLEALPAHIRKKMRIIHYADNFDVTNLKVEPLQQGQLYIVE